MAAPIPSREARPARAVWNVAKTLFQTAIFWSTLLFLVPAMIYWVEGATGLGGPSGGLNRRVKSQIVPVMFGEKLPHLWAVEYLSVDLVFGFVLAEFIHAMRKPRKAERPVDLW